MSNQAWMKEKIPEANETLKNFKVKKVEKVEFFKVGAIRKNFLTTFCWLIQISLFT